ncbi:SAM-dependent methyltransferase [Nocardiopsis potens]|uniref:SAM-dependent methyltransferase n=1 Tax=Nocardiopsis potens TaxID=1246458 RepID=UPI000348256C|nr:methyltransferase domain-containing protein [Nocardiopsis potens]
MSNALRFHERAEALHTILNPLSEAKLDLVGEICAPTAATRVLDLACGKGELLCRWAHRYGSSGTGVDLSPVFLAAARERAASLGVVDRVGLVEGEAARYAREEAPRGGFDVVSCLGATWIGGGLAGTLELMAPLLAEGGTMLVGEVYWHGTPSAGCLEAHGFGPDDYADLPGTADRIAAAGFELVEMVLSAPDDWDRYIAAQWRAVHAWLRENPGHPDAEGMRGFLDRSRRGHLEYGRDEMGWGVFVLRR